MLERAEQLAASLAQELTEGFALACHTKMFTKNFLKKK